MKLPSKVTLNGVDYTVEQVKGLNDGASILYGEFDEANQTIRIN